MNAELGQQIQHRGRGSCRNEYGKPRASLEVGAIVVQLADGLADRFSICMYLGFYEKVDAPNHEIGE